MYPQELTQQRRWACWGPHFENRFGDPFPEKAPITPVAGQSFAKGISSAVPSEWLEYDTAQAWAERESCGIGIMIGPDMNGNGAGWVGVDFDTYKLDDDDPLKRRIKEKVNRCPGYIESSPNGGVRIIIRGSIPRNRKNGAIEVYREKRFLRTTGDVIEAKGEVIEAQQWLDELIGLIGEGSDAISEHFEFGEIPDPDVASQTFERILEAMHYADRAAIIKADSGEVEASDACWQVCMALAKNDVDAAMAYTCLLAMEGVQKYYAEKYDDKAPAELHRKFCNYWWPNALAKAPAAVERDRVKIEHDARQLELIRPQIEAMVAKSLVQREAKIVAKDAVEVEKDRLSLARAAILQEEAKAHTVPDLDELPVPVMREYQDWVRSSVVESEESLVRVATLSHLSAIISRAYQTDLGSPLNLYLIVLAKQGAGKEVLSSAYAELTTQLRLPTNLVPVPRSDIALHKSLAKTPAGLLILKEFGDRMSEWNRPGHPAHMVPTVLKDIYGINAGRFFVGANYSDAAKDVPNIVSPALNLLGEGTREQVLQALTTHGTEDGLIGRFLFVEGGRNWIDNEVPTRSMPADLVETLSSCLTMVQRNSLAALGASDPCTVTASAEAKAIFAKLKAEEREAKRADDNPHHAFWRAATQNANKIAAVLAVYDNPAVPHISDVHAAWADAFVRRSIATAIAHMEIDGAYAGDDYRAAKALEKMIGNFFSPAGAKRGTDRQKQLQAQGRFRTGYLGEKLAAIKNHPKGPVIGLQMALRILIGDNKIERIEDRETRYAKGLEEYFYRLGDRWGQRD